MFKHLVRPHVLFMLGTAQGLATYLLWYIDGTPEYVFWTPTYIPVVFYIAGFVGFWFGTRAADGVFQKDRGLAAQLPMAARRLKKVAAFLLVALFLQVVFASVLVYHGIPLLEYVTKRMSVDDINRAQESSGFAQMGCITLTFILLTNALMLLAVEARHSGRVYSRAFTWVIVLVIMYSAVFAGKRQGVFMAACTMLVGLSFVADHPVRYMLSFLRLPFSGMSAYVLAVLIIPVAIVFMGGLANLRLLMEGGSATSGTREIFNYFSYPLANFEYQTLEVGWESGVSNPLMPFISLLPHKVFAQLVDKGNVTLAPVVITGSPSGFYGPLHWSWGLPASIVFTLVIGFIAQWCYVRARTSLFFLSTYATMVWPLLSIHSYNHFLNLAYLPFPIVIFAALNRYLGSREATPNRFSRTSSLLPRDGGLREQGQISAKMPANGPILGQQGVSETTDA